MRLSKLLGSWLVVLMPLSAGGQVAHGAGAWNGAWMTLAPMPTARGGVAVGEIDGIFYVVGGCCPGTSTNQAYNPHTDTWTTKAAHPQAIHYNGTNGAVVNGIMYVIGGNAGGFCTNANYAYDPVTNSWSSKASMPTGRCHLAVVAVGDLIYAIGGTDTSGSAQYTTVEVYNPASNTWATKASMPTGRSNLAAGVVNGIIYAVGGSNPGALATVEAYNPATNSWATKAPLPIGRSALGVAVANDIVYAFGGNSAGGYVNNVDAYDPATNGWTSKSPLSSPRIYPGCRSVDGVIYAIGGFDAVDSLTTVEAFLTPHSPSSCPADLTPGGDRVVNVGDLLLLISKWGACP